MRRRPLCVLKLTLKTDGLQAQRGTHIARDTSSDCAWMNGSMTISRSIPRARA